MKDLYVKAVYKSRAHALSRVMEQGIPNGMTLVRTRMDLGRATGKTEAAFQIIKESKNTLNFYVGKNFRNSICELKNQIKNGEPISNLCVLSKSQMETYCMGRTFNYSAYNIILDDAELREEQITQFVGDVIIASRNGVGHQYPFIHLIDLGE